LVESALAHFTTPSTDDNKRGGMRLLHVGSGGSIVGETLLEALGGKNKNEDDTNKVWLEQVVNVDCDKETMARMQTRWTLRHPESADDENNKDNDDGIVDKLQFVIADFSSATTNRRLMPEFPNGHFHAAMDKSTLDCTLCSDSSVTAGLLMEVYRLLTQHGGVYVCISFHHLDLLLPLLQDLPGADWDVSHVVMQRQVEDLIGNGGKKSTGATSTPGNETATAPAPATPTPPTPERQGAWTSGSFEPDEAYRRTVNVMICRRRPAGHDGDCHDDDNDYLDREAVMEHIHNTNDVWFQQHNPMLTAQRRETIQQLFLEKEQQQQHATTSTGTSKNRDHHHCHDLETAYEIIFTDAEREHLTFDLFMEDWEAWISEQWQQQQQELSSDAPLELLPRDKMSVETALAFLEAMQ